MQDGRRQFMFTKNCSRKFSFILCRPKKKTSARERHINKYWKETCHLNTATLGWLVGSFFTWTPTYCSFVILLCVPLCRNLLIKRLELEKNRDGNHFFCLRFYSISLSCSSLLYLAFQLPNFTLRCPFPPSLSHFSFLSNPRASLPRGTCGRW